MQVFEQACERFRCRSARIAVLGLGYAGLPLACAFAEAGFSVIGIDIDSHKVEQLNRGCSYIKHVEDSRIQRLSANAKFNATSDFSELSQADAAIICVPTPLGDGRSPDLRHVTNTAAVVRSHLHKGQLIVLESTTYPGTTEELLLSMFLETGLKPGDDFFLAFSPEREDPANRNFTTRTIPKIVGGVTDRCLHVACSAYGEVVDRVVPVSSSRVAEAAKLLENIYRCVNIALVNELKLLFERMDIDIWEVIAAASSKPFGFTTFYPGPGFGGHCVPVDPFYLSWKARQFDFQTRFIELAGEINTAIPAHVVDRIADGLNLDGKPLRGATVLLIGVAYKPEVDDIRESPALAIIRLLQWKLARVLYHDPLVPLLRSRHLEHDMKSVELTSDLIEAADATVIVTNHSAVDYELIARSAKLIIDTRNAMSQHKGLVNKLVTA
jgi:UDP-N-acetyl-D-glucosamine dehydrogenase